MKKKSSKPLLVLVCNYSAHCNGDCEKCQWLPKAKVVDLAKLGPVPTIERVGCDCGR